MSLKEIEQQIKDVYELVPHPEPDGKNSAAETGWSWINLNWIDSLLPCPTNKSLPFKNILIAGCGTGSEAFQMSNSFPDAEIIAVDYSEKAISLAKQYQSQHLKYSNIQFEVGNLTINEGNWVKSDHYDFISCHGVMSNIPDIQSAFDILAQCLSPTGVLYVGANGLAHVGISIRKSFEHFGYDTNKFENTLEIRRMIELFDRLQPYQNHIAAQTNAYLSSDILNTFSLNLSLFEWAGYAEKSNLNLLGTTDLISGLEKTLSPGIFKLLISRSRKELCELVEINNKSSFHRMIFSKQDSLTIPWNNFESLINCDFETTALYSMQNPLSDIYGEFIIQANIATDYTVSFRWALDDITIKLFNKNKKNSRLHDVLGDEIIEAHKNNQEALIAKLFMFYQFGLIKIFPNSNEPTRSQESANSDHE